MYSDKKDKYKELVKNIGYVDQLSTEKIIEISRELFELVSFCDCEVDKWYDHIEHRCDRFNFCDYIHSPTCRCCQKRILLYYLGLCMEKLAYDGRLPKFEKAHLDNSKILNRTYEHTRMGSELFFRIDRHLHAWTEEAKMEQGVQTWVFDFAQLSLKKLSYDVIPMGVSVRGLMESRSEWKGTVAELIADLKEAAKRLKINTKNDLWSTSTYKFNQILRGLKTYLVGFGITIEKGRYARIIKIWKAPV